MRLLFAFFSICAFCSCKKNISGSGNSLNSQIVINDTFYFKAKFNGADYLNWIVPSKNNQSAYQFHSGASFGFDSLGAQCTESSCFYLSAYSQVFTNTPGVKPQINIGFNMATQRKNRDEFLSWFTPGFKNYGLKRSSTLADIYNPLKNGVIIYYIDQNGKSWFSGDGQQQDSFFESISLSDLSGINNSYLNKIWKARFSCKLYDANGNWINVQNGEIYNRIMIP